MKKFRILNNLMGWLVFAIALCVYWNTMEPTASFWDCGEFIAASYGLEVPHPPGAPLFLMIGRLFSFLSFGDQSRVAYWINFVSVLSGAFTSLFLFWSITMLSRKLRTESEFSASEIIILLGAGFVGSLTYTFSDTAWFSSVEAEVYSMSSLFTAFVVWGMLKWEAIDDESRANRWLIFIFYVVGLSIGVHLLNLVTIPALVLIFYFKKFSFSKGSLVIALIIGLGIIFIINSVIITGLPSLAGNFEIFFVNVMSLPFGSGAITLGLLIVAGLVAGIYYTHLRNKTVLNVFFLAVTCILIGYSSCLMIIIRSNSQIPINENDPSDVMSFTRYLRREQYGSAPLLYGPYFTARAEGYEEGKPVYAKKETNYEPVDHRISVKYSKKDQTVLPRIWSTEENHQNSYRQLLNLKKGERPTFTDNIRFLFTHQIGWMYVRYFFFNFAGRESDEQNADWLGAKQWFKKLPPPLNENKGRNNFFMIPFVLGLVGMYFQIVNNTKAFFVIGLLFLLTGIALVVYLNSPPIEPRERDYIYVGSYYAYCIWIGFSVIALAELITKFTKQTRTAGMVAIVICLSAPALMAKEGWNDHNRSNRFFSVDTAINDLYSCAPDSILFTGGDNDTFPLWYAQEVEGVRNDMRVIVSSYFNTHWYIDQAMWQVHESKPIEFTLSSYDYREGGPNNPYLPYYDAKINSMNLKEYLALLKSDSKRLRIYESAANVIPSRDIVLPVDTAKVRALHIVPETLDSLIVPEMHLQLLGPVLELKDLAMLDILATAEWERPMYVTNTALSQFNIDLTPYAVKEGNTYRILPVLNSNPQNELVNTSVAYENMLMKFQFRGLNDSTIYYSEDYRGAVQNLRNNFNSVTTALLEEGEISKAKKLLLHGLDKMPDHGVRYDITHLQTIQLLFEVGERKRAYEIADKLGRRADELIPYYLAEGQSGRKLQLQMVIVQELARIFYLYNEPVRAKVFEDILRS